MPFFVKIDSNNIVKNSVSLDSSVAPTEEAGIAFLKQLYGQKFNWKQMGSAPFMSNGVETTRNYAGINFRYDESLDIFIEPQPFTSWILDETTGRYHPPVQHPHALDPNDSQEYRWNEETQTWDLIT